jgi:DnaK suppressor protein
MPKIEKQFTKFRGKDKAYYEALMNTRRGLMEQVTFHADEALNSDKNSAGERAGMSSHMADLGSDNFRHDMELGMLTAESEELELIEEAIQRIESGEYGQCHDCEVRIGEERLKAKPHALYCIKCKSIREENGGYRPDFED